MRSHFINTFIECDKDLTALSTNRILFEQVSDRRFKVTSKIKFYKCEIADFIKRLIYRNFGKPSWILGLCSTPSGYLYKK